MSNKNTAKETAIVINNLRDAGFSFEDSCALRRISMTLRNWFERECGSENGDCIERDETTGKPFVTYEAGSGPRKRYAIADREAGARKRLTAIMAKYPKLTPYVQTDCRGCALYILRASDVRKGESIDSIYNRGVAVY